MQTGTSDLSKKMTAFYLLNCIVVMSIAVYSINIFSHNDPGTVAYSLLLLLTYPLIYLAPALLAFKVSSFFLTGKMINIAIVIAILMSALISLVIFSDFVLYKLYGFHINMFVWNIVSTKGGIASLGFDQVSVYGLIGVGTSIIFAFFLLWLVAGRIALLRLPKLRYIFALFVMLTFTERGVYAVNHFFSRGDILSVANQWPLHQPAKASSLMEALGYQRSTEKLVEFDHASGGDIRYPIAELDIEPVKSPPNIVILVAESLRADMLTPEIMPHLWEFSLTNARFENHYSGGNGTRQGMFALFYGLYGNNWDRFLGNRVSPVLFSALDHYGYQRLAITSASFTYPEFDQTIFSTFHRNELRQDDKGPAWQRDIRNVDALISSLRDDEQLPHETGPKFRFMFFESTHARYFFPNENVIRDDYLQEVDYLKLTPSYLAENIEPLKNRYINASHHVDRQIGRLLDYLKASNELDNTILVITGDHGEAFMEKGRWGHNSDFSEEQVKVPLVVSVPGDSPLVVDYPTSHLDFVGTVLSRLGVKNPPTDYSMGGDLFAHDPSRKIVVSSWSDIGVITDKVKIVVPFRSTTQHSNLITSLADKPLAKSRIVQYMPIIRNIIRKGNSFFR